MCSSSAFVIVSFKLIDVAIKTSSYAHVKGLLFRLHILFCIMIPGSIGTLNFPTSLNNFIHYIRTLHKGIYALYMLNMIW